jgi:hypothetical protein
MMFSLSTCSEPDEHEAEYAFDVHADIAFVLVEIVAAVVAVVVVVVVAYYIDIQVLDIVHQCIVEVLVILIKCKKRHF